MFAFVLQIPMLFVLLEFANSKSVELKVKQGTLRGQYLQTVKGRLFSAFTAIPYAEPPIGVLRFKAARPAGSWKGILNASKPHSICPQMNIFVGQDNVQGDEDCLYLNVYTPQLPYPSEHFLPVMIFFHGGSFFVGDANRDSYNPKILLDKDVVLVVPNYRLGPLGFLSTGDRVVPGNNGLKDQNLAIQWVKTNIDVFGGDPKRITLFGQSAGGSSAHFHMLSPLSKSTNDLISGVISQSGTALSSWAIAPNDQGTRNSRKLARFFKCTTRSSRKMVDCLRRVDAYEIVRQQDRLYEWGQHPQIPFKPVIEPNIKGAFLPEHPADIIQSGKAANIPFLTGVNTEDGCFETVGIFPNQTLLEELSKDFDRVAPIALLYSETSPDKDFVTRNIKEFYLDDRPIDNSSRFDIIDMFTDGLYLTPAIDAVRLHLKFINQPVYYYAFGYRGAASFSSFFGDHLNDYGVCHADELLYLFSQDSSFPNYQPNATDRSVSETLTTLWVNFAATGNPTPTLTSETPVRWEPVQSENLEYFAINGETDTVMSERLYWEGAKFWKNLPVDSQNDLSSKFFNERPLKIRRIQQIVWYDYY